MTGSELELHGGLISFSGLRKIVRESPEEVKTKLKTIGTAPPAG